MKIALIFLFVGFLAGAFYGICRFIIGTFKNNIFIQIIVDFLYSIGVGFMFVKLNNHFLYGEIRLYPIVLLLLGLFSERKTLGKLFAKLYLILYNVGRKSLEKFKKTQLGKILFK